ncbi:MAG TPA: DNA recombination protein RmuC [Firmicutes bacterium]|nr:DNA recombination protein RmuC [Bacillota bacterium]
MINVLLIIAFLLVVNLILLCILLARSSQNRDYQVEARLEVFEKNQEKAERVLREETAKNREESLGNAKLLREELSNSFKMISDTLLGRMAEIANLQRSQLEVFAAQLANLTKSNEERMDKMRQTLEEKLKLLQEDNSQKLEQMRATVDEKLHETLEKRLGDSFKLVSERLELVHKGLGEMQTLASGVGDLKKVLTNIKTRGTWGEIQLGNLLEQVLAVEQYETNVITKKGSNERVEYAVKLPEGVLLPIDAKFPQEDYQRLMEAEEQADQVLVEEYGKQLEARIKAEAKDIQDKYLDPPFTTDFGIMFLPIEGLYAEVLRRPGLVDILQREYRVNVTGPTSLAALLNSLQMGFRTLTIQKRSSEVWSLLSAVKTEFGKFGDLLEKTHKKLQEASNTIVDAAQKSRGIERKLRQVQQLPAAEATNLLADIQDAEGEGDAETAGTSSEE